MALISINIPCHNRKEMLRECIQSFVDQTFGDWEIVVVDDGSTEDLTDIVDIDSRVKYYGYGKVGLPRAYNLALKHSTGKYIVPFGSDDIASDRHMLERLLNTIMEKKQYMVVYSDYIQRDKNGNEKVKKMVDINTLEDPYKSMLERQFIPHPGSFWKIGFIPRYDESLESAVDWELFLRALELEVSFYHLSEPLFTYRVGHEREGTKDRQAKACDIVLKRRGYRFDNKKRIGVCS